MKTFLVHFKSKAGDQYVVLQARNRGEAEGLAMLHQASRGRRREITFKRLDHSVRTGEPHPMIAVDPRRATMAKNDTVAWAKRETERRKRDFSRYDFVDTDEKGNTTFVAASAPLKIASVTEVK